MIPCVLSAVLGLILGLAASRRLSGLLLPRLRGLWLMLPTLALASLPYWLDRTAPALIWTDDRRLLLTIEMLRQALLIILIVINLLPHHLPLPRRLRQLARRLWHKAGALRQQAGTLLLPGRQPARPAAQRVHAARPERPATRWWHRLPMFGLLLAVVLQTAVLFANNGFMPLTADYLKGIDNPALVAGIRNGALLLHTIVGPATALPALALQYRLPLVERWFPGAFPWYGLADLIGAAALGLCLFSQFFGRLPGESRRKRVPARANLMDDILTEGPVDDVLTKSPADGGLSEGPVDKAAKVAAD